MTEARARIAAIDAGHRAAVEILSRLGFFPDESPSLGAKPASRTAAVTGDIDYGDDDDLEESARENHVEPKDDRPRVHASLGSESLAQRRADRRSQRRAGRRHAHLMGAQAARDAVERFYGADSEEARTVAAPYSTEAADAAADAELGLSQDGLVDLARETGDEVGYAEGLRTANDALGTSYTVAEMRREGSRRASGAWAGPGRRAGPGQRAAPAPGPELTLMLGETDARSRAGRRSRRARGRWRALPAAKERRDERVRQVAMTEARARIAAIDAGHRAAVEILSRLGFFPDESPSLGAKPASRTAAVTGDIDYGDDDDLEESARENHVEPKDDRPRVHASLGSESLAQRRADRRSQRRAGRRHAHLMGAQAARDAVERFYGADSEEARTVAAPYSTEAADAAADAELGLSQDGLVDLARETGDEVGYAEGLRTANDALGTSYTVAEMRRRVADALLGRRPGRRPGRRADRRPGQRPGRHADRRPSLRLS